MLDSHNLLIFHSELQKIRKITILQTSLFTQMVKREITFHAWFTEIFITTYHLLRSPGFMNYFEGQKLKIRTLLKELTNSIRMFRFGSFTLCVSSVVWHSFSFFLFFVQVKEIFENALNERMKQHACRGLGINIENPNSGFPTLDELDMQTIHEAYQFLTKKFVTDPKNKKSTSFLSIDQVKGKFVEYRIVCGWIKPNDIWLIKKFFL